MSTKTTSKVAPKGKGVRAKTAKTAKAANDKRGARVTWKAPSTNARTDTTTGTISALPLHEREALLAARALYSVKSKASATTRRGEGLALPSVSVDFASVKQAMDMLFTLGSKQVWEVLGEHVSINDLGLVEYCSSGTETMTLGARVLTVDGKDGKPIPEEIMRVRPALLLDGKGGKFEHGNRLYVALCAARGTGALDACRHLDLSNAEQLFDLRPLERLAALERLNLRGCANLTSLAELRGLPALRELAVTVTPRMDLTALSTLPALTALTLHDHWDTEWSEKEMQALLAQLGPLPGVRLHLALPVTELVSPKSSRFLSGIVELSAEGTALKSVASLVGFTELRALSLPECCSGDLGPLSRLTSLRSLAVSVGAATRLPAIPSLTDLKVNVCDVAGVASAVEAIAGCPALERLAVTLPRLPRSVRSDTKLAELPSLIELKVSIPDDEGLALTMQVIAGCPALERLEMELPRGQTGLPGIAEARNVSSLVLSGSSLADLSPVASLDRLRRLMICDCDGQIDLSPLATLPVLDELELHANVDSLAPITACTGLRRLVLRDGDELLLPVLERMTGLRELDVSRVIGLFGFNENKAKAGLARLRATLPECTILSDEDE